MADRPDRYGDFHLLDLPDITALDRLSKQEVAEILYLSHKWQPFTTPFFPGLGNTFALLAHDDGWYVLSYFRDAERFYSLYAEILRQRIEQGHGRRLPSLPSSIISALAEWAREGLYIDLHDVTKSRTSFTLNLYLLGPGRAPHSPGGPPDTDGLFNNLDEYKQRSRLVHLCCQSRRWTVEP